MAIGTNRSDILQVDPATAAAATAEVERKRDKGPSELASEKTKQDRKQFLGDSLRETRAPEEIERIYERVLGGNDLMPVAYLERGAIAARAVARIDLGGGQYGTGFLIAPRVLITNNHVIGDKATAARATANFQYEVNLKDAPAQKSPSNSSRTSSSTHRRSANSISRWLPSRRRCRFGNSAACR